MAAEGEVRDSRYCCCWLEDEGAMCQGNGALSPVTAGTEFYLKGKSSPELPDKMPAWLPP